MDLHFGHAEENGICAVAPKGIRYLETRQVEHYCQGGYGDEDEREVILRAIADCTALFVARVGDGPRTNCQEPVSNRWTITPWARLKHR